MPLVKVKKSILQLPIAMKAIQKEVPVDETTS